MSWSNEVAKSAMAWCQSQWDADTPASLELSCSRLGGAAPVVPMSTAHPATPDVALPPGLDPAECLVLSDAHGMVWLIEPGGSLLDVPMSFAYRGCAYDAVRQFANAFRDASGLRASLFLVPANLFKQGQVDVCSEGSARDALSSILAGLSRPVSVVATVSNDWGLGLSLGLPQRVYGAST